MKQYQIAADVQAVITSYNQRGMIAEAVHTLWQQSTPPAKIIIVDDGSTDSVSLEVLRKLETTAEAIVPVTVIYQSNGGVSAARNTGIKETQSPLVLVLDGDDRLEPSYIEQVSQVLRYDTKAVAASSWMHTFGVMDAIIRPSGGDLRAFLPRNACPATHILRRSAWEKCGGYDETMRAGFEDWEFFLHMLETCPDASIHIVEQPLLNYRTAPASANVQSMEKRLSLMKYIIEKHADSYRQHMTEAILGIEATSMSRLYGWESEILHSCASGNTLSDVSQQFLNSPSYGDGGMAAAVRIASK